MSNWSRRAGYVGVVAVLLGVANAWGWTLLLGVVLVLQAVGVQFYRGYSSA